MIFKRYQRYFARIAIGNLLLATLTVSVLFVLIDFVFKAGEFDDSGLGWRAALAYYATMLPQILYLLGPFIVLLGGMFGLSRLLRGQELLPLRVGGLRLGTALMPFWFMALLAGAGMYSIQEWVLPGVAEHALEESTTSLTKGRGERALVQDEEGNSWFIGRYDVLAEPPMLEDVDIWRLDERGRSQTREFAPRLEYVNGRWQGERSVLRLDSTSDASAESGPITWGTLPPGAIARRSFQLQPSITELYRASREERHRPDIKLAYYRALSYPLLGLGLLMVGSVIAVRLRVRNAMIAVALSFAVAFAAIALRFVLEAMAGSGVISAEFGGFGVLALVLVLGFVLTRWRLD